jgi:alginate O-acetyltransferase complex protein AlgI
MLFNSFKFLYFFVAVWGLYLVLDKKGQNRLLLGASYYFYGCWDPRFLLLLLASTVIDFSCGLGMRAPASPRRRRACLRLSLGSNLSILFIFKYFNFFAESFRVLLASRGIMADARVLALALPVGISFYTFQSINYTLAVYRGRMRACEDFFDFALFIAFFPQLVAGPIERAEHLLPQVQNPRTISYGMVRDGLWLILLGYFKKLVLADNMVEFTRPVFNEPDSASGGAVLVAIYAFAFQIYGDFSGYSDIARGTARLLGFDLMRNFRHPYFATNPSDFWRRWHISLSSWLRDNMFIPIGGSRGGRWLTHRNLMITMVLGGLWHGAAWNFVAWGVFHGGILVLFHMLPTSAHAAAEKARPGFRALGTAFLFFQVTCIGWLLFAVKRLADVPILMDRLILDFRWTGAAGLLAVAGLGLPLLALEWAEERAGTMDLVKRWPRPARLACYASVFALIVVLGAQETYEFIYFQF